MSRKSIKQLQGITSISTIVEFCLRHLHCWVELLKIDWPLSIDTLTGNEATYTIAMHYSYCRAVASSPAGPVLAGPVFLTNNGRGLNWWRRTRNCSHCSTALHGTYPSRSTFNAAAGGVSSCKSCKRLSMSSWVAAANCSTIASYREIRLVEPASPMSQDIPENPHQPRDFNFPKRSFEESSYAFFPANLLQPVAILALRWSTGCSLLPHLRESFPAEEDAQAQCWPGLCKYRHIIMI